MQAGLLWARKTRRRTAERRRRNHFNRGGACRSHWVLSTLSNDPCLGLFCLYVLFVVGRM